MTDISDDTIQAVARAIWDEAIFQEPYSDMGYREANNNTTILDGAFDLDEIAKAAIEAYKESEE
jgi:hypothetical protein